MLAAKLRNLRNVAAKATAITRCVFVNDFLVYFQGERFLKAGTFVREYGHLKLP